VFSVFSHSETSSKRDPFCETSETKLKLNHSFEFSIPCFGRFLFLDFGVVFRFFVYRFVYRCGRQMLPGTNWNLFELHLAESLFHRTDICDLLFLIVLSCFYHLMRSFITWSFHKYVYAPFFLKCVYFYKQ